MPYPAPKNAAQKKANYVGGRPKDESRLSKEPRQIRNRLRRRATALEADMEMLYGKPLEDWDLEELARGRPRASDGRFTGPKPKWISAAVQVEAKRRLLEETHGMLAGHVHQAVRTMADLMTSQELDDKGKPIVDARTRFAAAAFIIEHLIGKPVALADVKLMVDEPKQAIAAAIVLDDGLPQDVAPQVIEGDVVEDDEEEWDDDDASE
jgi:hypothetical protein